MEWERHLNVHLDGQADVDGWSRMDGVAYVGTWMLASGAQKIMVLLALVIIL